jgi:hypothetical protein
MTGEEVKAAIQKATEAVREYKKTKNIKQASPKTDSPFLRLTRILEEIQENDLSESVKELIKESYEVGLAGDACPTCNGTGRV